MNNIAWTWIFIRASGITTWALLTCVVLWGIALRTRVLGQTVPPVRLMEIHRWLGTSAVFFLVIHLGLLLVDPYVTFTIPQLFIPFLSEWKPIAVAAGIATVWAFLPVLVIAPARKFFGKNGPVLFKKAHYFAYAAWPLATMHYILAGTDTMELWSIVLILAGMSLILFMLITRGFVPKPTRTHTREAKTVKQEIPAE